MRRLFDFAWIGRLLWLGLVGAALYLAATWLKLPLAPNLDAVIGIITMVWLFFIVTVPWNIYFQAHQVVFDANVSRTRGIAIDADGLAYASRWSRIALVIALGLHGVTASALCAAALSGIGFIGWFGAAAAILLTVVRPGLRAYAHVRERLGRIGNEIEVPREDAIELRRRLANTEHQLEMLTRQFNTRVEETDRHLQALKQRATESSDCHIAFVEHMRLELIRVERDAKNTMAQILGDAAVVGHVRELVRFFKQA